MATSSEIKQRANALAEKTDVNSITPKEVGGIMYDLASHSENVLRNGGTLGIRKVYESVAAMEADSTNPKDLWGEPLKKGNLVVIYDGTSTGVDNNKIYAFMKPGWQIATHLDAGYATKASLDAAIENILLQFRDSENALNESIGNLEETVNGNKQEVDGKLSELGSKVRGVIQGETYNIIANEDWNSITGAFFKSSTYSRSELFKVRGKAILNSSDDSLLLSKGKVLTFSDALMLPSSLVKEYSSFGEYLSAGISKEEQYIMFFFQANYNKATEFVITFSKAAPSLEYVDEQVTKIDEQVTKTESLMHRQNNRLNFTTDVFDLSDFVLTIAEFGSQYNSATKEVIIYGETANGI